ncbi:MAG: hypothetical protein JST31_12885 [Actinobacteria bacterium]|nr:hypothetical protein [Actinomycetota bacterium]
MTPFAHIAGIPVEETVTMLLPAFSVGFGALVINSRDRIGRIARRLGWRRRRR